MRECPVGRNGRGEEQMRQHERGSMERGTGNATIKLLYDGNCPICAAEMRRLRRLDRRGRLAFEDISTPGFDPLRYEKTREQLMGAMHAILPDGGIVTGMEAFRRAYAAAGHGWLLAPTGWPLLRPLFDSLYRRFAGNRMKIGRFFGRGCPEGHCPIR